MCHTAIQDSTGMGKITCSYSTEDQPNTTLSQLASILENGNVEKTSVASSSSIESGHEDDADALISVQTDKNVYLYGSEIVVTVVIPYTVSGATMIITVTDFMKSTVVYRTTIPVSEEASDRYQEIIKIQGKDWAKPNSKFKISVKYADKEASCYILTELKLSIELDQEIYSWTDKVYIKAVVPSLLDLKAVYASNNKKYCLITISTNRQSLRKYKLVETKTNTGIFSGEIRLTGFPNYDAYEFKALVNGETSGVGPNDGKIGCSNEDVINVALVTDTSMVSASALIRWYLGDIRWSKSSYSISEEATLRVIDRDMNLNPEKKDKFPVRVYSDSDRDGILIEVVETGNATGIFNGIVKFVTEEQSSSPRLRVSRGDTITAVYSDWTLPAPDSRGDRLAIVGHCVVGYIPPPPLQRVSARKLKVLDLFGNVIDKAYVHQEIKIAAELTNTQDIEQKFAFLVQIKNVNGGVLPPLHTDGILYAGETLTSAVSWVPDNSGLYTMSAFVWKSIDDPDPLSDPLKSQIKVENNNMQNLPHKTLAGLDQKLKELSIHTVCIPHGSSVSGCEKDHACYIPSKLVVDINDAVVWINVDVVSHTVTSGTVDNGPDGNFDSRLFEPETSFAHRFTRKGTYHYFCIPHPWQRGTIVVE